MSKSCARQHTPTTLKGRGKNDGGEGGDDREKGESSGQSGSAGATVSPTKGPGGA
jgi:hypothetical protein